MKSIFGFTVTVVFCVLILYGILHYFDLKTGDLVDWIVGVVSFLWMMMIVTVPWNAHFKAREVLDDAEISQRKEILVIESSLKYAKRVAKWSLIVAISLHILSAVALFFIALMDVSPVGYFAAGAAALLTFLRPAVRFYEYLQQRLRDIKREFRYPREDVQEMLLKFKSMNKQVNELTALLSLEKDAKSWRQDVNDSIAKIHELQKEHELYVNKFHSDTQTEFQVIRKEAQQHFAKITTDSQILDSVREIAKFLKQI